MKIYTTAPEDYDGFGTRLVDIPDEWVAWQVARYGSGLHMAVTEVEWRQLVEYRLETP